MLEVTTPSGRWAPFVEQIRRFLAADRIEMELDGLAVRGYRSPDTPALWIRDHSDMLRAGRFFEADVQSAVTAFARSQSAGGRVFDYVTVFPEKKPCERENWEKWVRVPVEADVEYRFVKAAWLAWQATGDEGWLEEILPALDRALRYTRTHPWRWDEATGLVKRPYTIDTWDFDYTAGRAPWLNFQVTDETFWGLSHADNSGFYEACLLLARLYETAGRADAAARWSEVGGAVRERANRLLFNGRFYTHFHKLTAVEIPGVDEAAQLSLSNPMAINRGLATHEMAVEILREYRRRRASGGAFAEWFGIDPPFPDGIFGDELLVAGAYINGGIYPLVGGELARAAFEHGFEGYGVQTLVQYAGMIAERGETYLWYFPDGRVSTVETSTSPEATPTDGWGSSAMLYALVEGLCGIEDEAHGFRSVRCAPRWIAAGEDEATVRAGYEASGARFGYRFAHDADARRIRLHVEAADAAVRLHVLLPEGRRASALRWDGAPVPFATSHVETSPYADAEGRVRAGATVEILYE